MSSQINNKTFYDSFLNLTISTSKKLTQKQILNFLAMDLKDLKGGLPKEILTFLFETYDHYKSDIESSPNFQVDTIKLLFSIFSHPKDVPLEENLKNLIYTTDQVLFNFCDTLKDLELKETLFIFHKKIRNLAAEQLCQHLKFDFKEKNWEICITRHEGENNRLSSNEYFFLYMTQINGRKVYSAKSFALYTHQELSEIILLNPDPLVEPSYFQNHKTSRKCTVVCFLQSSSSNSEKMPEIKPLLNPSLIIDGQFEEDHPSYQPFVQWIKKNPQATVDEIAKKRTAFFKSLDITKHPLIHFGFTIYHGFPNLADEFYDNANAVFCLNGCTAYEEPENNNDSPRISDPCEQHGSYDSYVWLCEKVTKFFCHNLVEKAINKYTEETSFFFPLSLTDIEWKHASVLLMDELSKDVKMHFPLICWLAEELELEIDKDILAKYALEDEKVQMEQDEIELTPQTMIKCFKHQALNEFMEAQKHSQQTLENSNDNHTIHPSLMQEEAVARQRHLEKAENKEAEPLKISNNKYKKPKANQKKWQKQKIEQSSQVTLKANATPLPEHLRQEVKNIFKGHPKQSKEFAKLCANILKSKMEANELSLNQERQKGAHPKVHFKRQEGTKGGITFGYKHGNQDKVGAIFHQKKTLRNLLNLSK